MTSSASHSISKGRSPGVSHAAGRVEESASHQVLQDRTPATRVLAHIHHRGRAHALGVGARRVHARRLVARQHEDQHGEDEDRREGHREHASEDNVPDRAPATLLSPKARELDPYALDPEIEEATLVEQLRELHLQGLLGRAAEGHARRRRRLRATGGNRAPATRGPRSPVSVSKPPEPPAIPSRGAPVHPPE